MDGAPYLNSITQNNFIPFTMISQAKPIESIPNISQNKFSNFIHLPSSDIYENCFPTYSHGDCRVITSTTAIFHMNEVALHPHMCNNDSKISQLEYSLLSRSNGSITLEKQQKVEREEPMKHFKLLQQFAPVSKQQTLQQSFQNQLKMPFHQDEGQLPIKNHQQTSQYDDVPFKFVNQTPAYLISPPIFCDRPDQSIDFRNLLYSDNHVSPIRIENVPLYSRDPLTPTSNCVVSSSNVLHKITHPKAPTTLLPVDCFSDNSEEGLCAL